MVITELEVELITDPDKKRKLREMYIAEYKRLTGVTLICTEKRFNRSISGFKSLAKEHIVRITSDYMKVDISEITGKSRKPELVKIRQLIVYLLSETRLKREQIYPIVGYTDASTVNYSVQTVKNIISVDKDFKEEYKKYREHCLSELTKLVKPSKKLTKEQEEAILLSIKKGGISQQELGEIYGVSRFRIQSIHRAHKEKESRLKKLKGIKTKV